MDGSRNAAGAALTRREVIEGLAVLGAGAAFATGWNAGVALAESARGRATRE